MNAKDFTAKMVYAILFTFLGEIFAFTALPTGIRSFTDIYYNILAGAGAKFATCSIYMPTVYHGIVEPAP
jgi:hypothetical protein